jgi:hypothetical protein
VSVFAPMRARTSCSSSKRACSRDIAGDFVFDRGFAASNGIMAAVDLDSITETVLLVLGSFFVWGGSGEVMVSRTK